MKKRYAPVRRKLLTFLLFLLLTMINVPLTATAGVGTPGLSARAPKPSVYAGQTVEIVLSFNDLAEKVSCFDMEVQMDADRFAFKKVTPLGTMEKSELSAHTAGDVTYLVYCDREGGQSPVGAEALFSIIYTVKEDVTAGQAEFLFQCTSMGNGKAQKMSLASARCTVQVTDPPSDNASLKRLTPSAGRLVPAFSSAQLSYTLEVGSAVNRVKLMLKTSHAQATAKVNRETLNGKGRSTRLVVTVTAPNRSVKKYIITVLRRKDSKTGKVEENANVWPDNEPGVPEKMALTDDTGEKTPLHTPAFPIYPAAAVLILLAGVPFLFRWMYKMTESKKEAS